MNTHKKQRKGIAVIIAMIFMMAFLTISTTIAKMASNALKSTQDSWKSTQAYYNAESAVEEALYYYKNPEKAPSVSSGEIKEGETTIRQWKILNVSSAQGNLSNQIGDWRVYPFPGTGTAGKNCDVYDQIASAENETATQTADKYSSLLQKYGIASNAASDFGPPEDFSCNWNKIKSFDSAVEIPLYAIAPDGTKVWLKFDEIQIKVRTACDETKLKEPNATTGQGENTKKSEEKILYDETGMCGKEKRYKMMAGYDPAIESTQEKTKLLQNTPLNWGIYSDKGDTNYLIPIKDKGKPIADIANSNIHTLAINTASSDFPEKPVLNPQSFVVLDGDVLGTAGFNLSKKWRIIDTLNQPSVDDSKPQISNPYLRLTVENKFLSDKSDYNESKYIPHLEYQILYKINEIETQQILNAMGLTDLDTKDLQMAGKPVIIGVGYSGGFMHTVRLEIIETKTGFDYVYQKP